MKRSNPITKLIGLLGFTLFIFVITVAVVEDQDKLVKKTQEEQIIEALNGTLEVAEQIKIRRNTKIKLDQNTDELIVINTTPKAEKKSTQMLYALL